MLRLRHRMRVRGVAPCMRARAHARPMQDAKQAKRHKKRSVFIDDIADVDDEDEDEEDEVRGVLGGASALPCLLLPRPPCRTLPAAC